MCQNIYIVLFTINQVSQLFVMFCYVLFVTYSYCMYNIDMIPIHNISCDWISVIIPLSVQHWIGFSGCSGGTPSQTECNHFWRQKQNTNQHMVIWNIRCCVILYNLRWYKDISKLSEKSRLQSKRLLLDSEGPPEDWQWSLQSKDTSKRSSPWNNGYIPPLRSWWVHVWCECFQYITGVLGQSFCSLVIWVLSKTRRLLTRMWISLTAHWFQSLVYT